MNFFSKYKHVLSLGGGCYVSMNLNRCKLRKVAYVFDWVWNQDYGLFAIADIVKDKFQKMSKRENFSKTYHYNLDNGQKMVVNKQYPHIAYVHHNLVDSDEDYEAFLRRIQRFLELFENKKDKILFIFYRDQGRIEQTPKEQLKYCDFTKILEEESIYFIEEIQKLYPDLDFDLLSLYASHRENLDEINLPQNRTFNKTNLIFDKLPAVKDDTKEALEVWNENLDEIFYRHGIYADFNTFVKKYKKITRSLGNNFKQIIKRKHLF